MRTLAVALILALAAAGLTWAYTYQGNTNVAANGGRPHHGTLPVPWVINDQTSDALANMAAGSDPQKALRDGFAEWESESGFSATEGALSTIDSVGNDGVHLMTFADTTTNRDKVGGVNCGFGPLAVTILRWNGSNQIIDGDILFNPCYGWSTTGVDDTFPVSSVGTHEIGHFLGLDHSVVGAATMYPFGDSYGTTSFSAEAPASISGDDRAGANGLYAAAAFAAKTGSIDGLVTRSSLPLYGAHVVATRISDGIVFASDITRGTNLTGENGRYRIDGLPPGDYRVHAEPADGPTTHGNWGPKSGSNSFWYDTVFATDWKTTFLGGNASPSTVTVTAGMTTTPADLAVTDGLPLDNPTRIGRIIMGSASWSGIPLTLPAGETSTLVVIDDGGGVSVDNSAAVTCSDPSVTIGAVSEPFMFMGGPEAIAFDVTIPAGVVPGPRTLIFTTDNGETSTLTGFIDVAGTSQESDCGNAFDDDGDGCIDCDDADCDDNAACTDLCPEDPNKTEPGVCGCGTPDDDTDGDLVEDCIDPCPADNPDDSDGDGVCNSADICPGFDDAVDGDGDGTPDGCDGCPADGTKTAAGVCGCGTPETDTDGDGTPDCVDPCPADNPDDSDGDGVCDSADICPGFNDATDGDGDGTPDGCDGCPADMNKTTGGVCGCGTPDDDSDGDGTEDCIDDCPADMNKTSPGACGCGVPDEDVDGDTVPDCCVAGDIWPDGVGDDAVDLRDWGQAVLKAVAQTVAIVDQDLTCGDVGPTQSSCLPTSGPRRTCPNRDGAFTAADADVIRMLAAGTDQVSCDPCLSDRNSPGGAFRRVGDVAPRPEGGDGMADVTDVLLILNWAVGLQSPPSIGTDEFVRADLTPTMTEGALRVVLGNDLIDVSDVLALLRHVVGLDVLAWPLIVEVVREIDSPANFVGFQVTMSGWDDFAENWDWTPTSASCDLDGGLDLIDNTVVVTCFGTETSGSQDLFDLSYRAHERSTAPTFSVKLIEGDFDLRDGNAVLDWSSLGSGRRAVRQSANEPPEGEGGGLGAAGRRGPVRMNESPPISRTLSAALLLALASSPVLAEPPTQVDWDRSESALVLRYEEHSDKLEGVAPLVLELFGDGRVLVTRPEPYANAGSLEARLSPGEVQRLLRLIALPEVVAFDEEGVREEMRERASRRRNEAAAAGRSPLLVYRSEKERIALELHLLRYRATPGAPSSEVDQRIEWRGLRQDGDEFPQHPALTQLASAVETARTLLDDLSGGE